MPLSRDDITRLIDIEAQLQNVPTGLARAVAYHESGFDPQIEGDGGNAIGLFQLHKGAAIDAGIDPKDRWDPAKNIFAGVRYLRQKLDQSGGKIDEALSRYNRGTPDYRGIGDPNYVQRVKRYYTPEGAQPSQAQPTQQQPQQPGILARMGQALSPASAEAATPQAAPRTRLEEIEAELARREQQATPQPSPQAPGATIAPSPASQAAPPPQAAPEASQGPAMRLSLGDPTQAATEPEARATIEAMRARLSAPPQATGSPGAAMEGNLLSDRSQVAEGGPQVPLSTAFPAAAKQTAATAINAVPFAVGTLAGGPVTGAIAESILQPVAHEVNVRLGLEERGTPWFSIKGQPIDTQHILGAALPWAGPVLQAGARYSRAGRALTAADTATQEAIDTAQATYNKARADYLANKISYKEAEAIQTEAVKKVRQLPGTYAPATPSRELYEQMVEAAPNAPVDLAPMLQQIPTWRQSVEHAGPQVGNILDKIEAMGNTTDVASLYNEVMKDLGRLTSKGSGAARGVATEMYGAVHDALEASALQIPGTAVAADVLKAARTSFRREKAVENLERIVQPGGTVVKYDNQGRLVVNPAMLQNRVEKLIGQDRFFAGSFQPDELAQLRSDVGSFAGTPKIPTRMPEAPPPMEMPAAVEPRLTPLINRPGRKALYGAEAVASIASGRMPSTYEFALMGADVVSQGIAKLLLAPGGREMLRKAIRADGVLDPAIYPVIQQLGVAKDIDTYRQPQGEKK